LNPVVAEKVSKMVAVVQKQIAPLSTGQTVRVCKCIVSEKGACKS
jgi:hypothetical protein